MKNFIKYYLIAVHFYDGKRDKELNGKKYTYWSLSIFIFRRLLIGFQLQLTIYIPDKYWSIKLSFEPSVYPIILSININRGI